MASNEQLAARLKHLANTLLDSKEAEERCERCGGSGEIGVDRDFDTGEFDDTKPCPNCSRDTGAGS